MDHYLLLHLFQTMPPVEGDIHVVGTMMSEVKVETGRLSAQGAGLESGTGSGIGTPGIVIGASIEQTIDTIAEKRSVGKVERIGSARRRGGSESSPLHVTIHAISTTP